jgi:hypothetical protein
MDNQGEEYQTRAAIGVTQFAKVPPHDNLRQQYRRRNEDVDYWRHRSGWFDDDQAMRDYNNGVYDAYYQPDGENQKGSGGGLSASNLDVKKTVIRSLVALFLLGVCIFMYRLVSKRFGGSTDDSKEKRKRSSSRERSGSRSRSRSRSRKGGDYDLMSEEEDGKSSRSKGSHRSRSKSKSGRSASRTRTRSRSTSRKESSSKPSPSATAEAILV